VPEDVPDICVSQNQNQGLPVPEDVPYICVCQNRLQCTFSPKPQLSANAEFFSGFPSQYLMFPDT
jgi:hypothetical protein